MGMDLCGILELRLDLLCKLFTQLDSNGGVGKKSGKKTKEKDWVQ